MAFFTEALTWNVLYPYDPAAIAQAMADSWSAALMDWMAMPAASFASRCAERLEGLRRLVWSEP